MMWRWLGTAGSGKQYPYDFIAETGNRAAGSQTPE